MPNAQQNQNQQPKNSPSYNQDNAGKADANKDKAAGNIKNDNKRSQSDSKSSSK
jgi:hypothetical protein